MNVVCITLLIFTVVVTCDPCVLRTKDRLFNLHKMTLSSGAQTASGPADKNEDFAINICGPVNNFEYSSICDRHPGSTAYMIWKETMHCVPMTANATEPDFVAVRQTHNGLEYHTTPYYTPDGYMSVTIDITCASYTGGLQYKYMEWHSDHWNYGFTMFGDCAPQPSSCSVQTSQGLINLAPLRLTNSSYSANYKNVTFALNICGAVPLFKFSELCNAEQPWAKAYEVDFHDSNRPACYPISDVGTEDISIKLIDPANPSGGVILTYATMDYKLYKTTTNIKLTCDKSVDSPKLMYVNQDDAPGQTTFYFSMATKHACPVN